jgi:hypothetical protein
MPNDAEDIDFKARIKEHNTVFTQITALLDEAVMLTDSDQFTSKDRQSTFSKIESLGPLVPSIMLQVLPYIRYKRLFHESFALIASYLEAGLKENSWNTKGAIIKFLAEDNEQGLELLEMSFRANDVDKTPANAAEALIADTTRVDAAEALAQNTNRGLPILIRAIEGENEREQVAAISGIIRTLWNRLQSQKKLGNEHEPFLKILTAGLTHRNNAVRIACITALSSLGKMPLDVAASAIDDPDSDVRRTGLHALLKTPLNSTSASIFARALEDSSKSISDYALSHLDTAHVGDPEAVARAIIDELIIRSSGRPKEHFNTKLTAEALQKTCALSPRLLGIVLHLLRDAAYDHHDNSIMMRSVLVARLVDKREFVSLSKRKGTTGPRCR